MWNRMHIQKQKLRALHEQSRTAVRRRACSVMPSEPARLARSSNNVADSSELVLLSMPMMPLKFTHPLINVPFIRFRGLRNPDQLQLPPHIVDELGSFLHPYRVHLVFGQTLDMCLPVISRKAVFPCSGIDGVRTLVSDRIGDHARYLHVPVRSGTVAV